MRRQLLILFVVLTCAVKANAQWQPTNPATSDNGSVYHLTGSVGIGTSAPEQKLHVAGNIKVDGEISPSSFSMASTDGQTKFVIQKPASTGQPFSITLGYQNIDGGIMIGRNDWLSKVYIPWNLALGSTTPTARFHVQQSGPGWSDGIRLSYQSRNWDIVSDANGDRLVIARNQDFNSGMVIYNGNVGLGLSAPEEKLHVMGNIKAAGVSVTGDISAGSVGMLSDDGQSRFFIQKPLSSGKPFTISLGYQNIDGGIMIGREDWMSKVLIPWKVAIGTNTPDADSYLTVDGKVKCEEINVEIIPGTGPDYVFDEEYELEPLAELATFINQHKRLPDVPSASDMEKNGLNLSEMNLLLLKKVEELTLHLIEQNRRIEKQDRINEMLLQKIEALKAFEGRDSK